MKKLLSIFTNEPMKSTITGYIAEYRATKNISSLLNAAILTVRQRRVIELAYGGYCQLRFAPPKVSPSDYVPNTADILRDKLFYYRRDELINIYGERFNVCALPFNFAQARGQSIVQGKDSLIVGEYAENSARIAKITANACEISDYYNVISGVRHIHSVTRNGNNVYVSTGDTAKVLDLWMDGDELKFKKRLKIRFAGFTAAININGKCYFGTDFSSRPNYIETLEGEKYFFPKKAYNQCALAFYEIENRYLVAVNCDMAELGDKKTISLFDTTRKEFIYSEYLD